MADKVNHKKPGRPEGTTADKTKTKVTIRLDGAVIDYFKGDNPRGWQKRLQAALAEWIEQDKGRA